MTHAFAGMGVPLLLLIFLSAWLLLYAMVSGWLPVAMDKPNGRSLHQIPTPRTGGLAICLALVIGLPWLDGWEVQAMAYGALLLGAVSLADDFWDLSPLIRFPLHLLVALCAVAYVQPSQEIWIMAVSVLAIAWMTNLFNFMDGSNGLAGGMALIGFGAYAWACLHAGAGALGLLTASVAVSAFAFLLFNFHPARIFMGDTGAIPLGFLAH